MSPLSMAVELSAPSFISDGLFLPGDDEDSLAISANDAFVVFRANENDGSSYDLYAYNTVTKDRIKLNSPLITGGSVREFWLTPDSSAVVFLAQKFSTNALDLFVVPIQGGTERQLTVSPAHDEFIQSEGIVSADSKYFVFRSDRDTVDQQELFSVRLDIEEAPKKLNAPIPDNRSVDSTFRISPDSQKVVFLANTNTASNEDLFVAPIDASTSAVRITPDVAEGGRANRVFFISDDSSLLVYNASHSGFNHWYSVPLAGGNSTLLTGAFASGFIISSLYGSLSNNGEQFVFQADDRGSSVLAGRRFYSIDTDGSSAAVDISPIIPEGIDANADLNSPLFAPQGLDVMYLSEFKDNVTPELFIATAGVAASATRVNGDLAASGTRNGVNSSYQFSPDNTKVSYIAPQDTAGIRELYLASVDGGPSTRLNAQLDAGGSVFSSYVFSNDSQYLAFVASKSRAGDQSGYLATVDGEEVINLNEALSLNTADDEGYIVRFSPNSDYLIYEVYVDALDRYTYQLIEVLEPEDDTFCFPIKLANSKVVVPCL